MNHVVFGSSWLAIILGMLSFNVVWFNYYYGNCAVLIFFFLIAAFNGSTFYVDVYSQNRKNLDTEIVISISDESVDSIGRPANDSPQCHTCAKCGCHDNSGDVPPAEGPDLQCNKVITVVDAHHHGLSNGVDVCGDNIGRAFWGGNKQRGKKSQTKTYKKRKYILNIMHCMYVYIYK